MWIPQHEYRSPMWLSPDRGMIERTTGEYMSPQTVFYCGHRLPNLPTGSVVICTTTSWYVMRSGTLLLTLPAPVDDEHIDAAIAQVLLVAG